MSLSWLDRVRARFGSAPPLTWDGTGIYDEWFRAHFEYAADIVAEWLGAERVRFGPMLDFGSGDGITLLGLMLRHGLPQAVGVDISTTHRGLPALARAQIGLARLPDELRFQRISPGHRFDIGERVPLVMSWSTFEHVPVAQLEGIFANIRDSMTDDGLFFLQINPLFHSPQGSHLGRFRLPPWAHLVWDEERLTQAVRDFDGEIPPDELEENFFKRDFSAYKEFVLDEYRQLNGLTCDELVQHLSQAGFAVLRESRGQVDAQPPAELLTRYSPEDLLTDEIRLLLRKA